jgi:hypothetical protein
MRFRLAGPLSARFPLVAAGINGSGGGAAARRLLLLVYSVALSAGCLFYVVSVLVTKRQHVANNSTKTRAPDSINGSDQVSWPYDPGMFNARLTPFFISDQHDIVYLISRIVYREPTNLFTYV